MMLNQFDVERHMIKEADAMAKVAAVFFKAFANSCHFDIDFPEL